MSLNARKSGIKKNIFYNDIIIISNNNVYLKILLVELLIKKKLSIFQRDTHNFMSSVYHWFQLSVELGDIWKINKCN